MSTAEGTVDCLYTQTVGSVSYVSVLNKGTVDYSSYQRFTCLVRLDFILKKIILNRKHLSCECVFSIVNIIILKYLYERLLRTRGAS